MKISDIAIRNPVFTWMLMLSLIVFGLFSFSQMNVDLLPEVEFPQVTVKYRFDGASPAAIESEILRPVEAALSAVSGVEDISSVAVSGFAVLRLQLQSQKNIDGIVQEIHEELRNIQGRLSEGVSTPKVEKMGLDQPIMWIAASLKNADEGQSTNEVQTGNEEETLIQKKRELMVYVADQLKSKFLKIEGVGDVVLDGYQRPQLRISLRAKDLTKHKVSVSDVYQSLRRENIELPGGFLRRDNKELSLRILGRINSVAEIQKIPLYLPGRLPGQVIVKKIGDVADIEYGLEEARRISRANGEESLGLGIRKKPGANAVNVARRVREALPEIKKNLPSEFQLHPNYDSTRFIQESIDELIFALLLAGLFTGLVCWLFLGSWSANLNVLLAIPTSIFGSFILLQYWGFTLNLMTLLGLSLAIGLVVDDAIMVLENIVRHRQSGRSLLESASIGAREVSMAAVAATVSIMAVFLPVAYVSGVVGQFLLQFGVTISVAVTFSLLEALTLTPMRTSRFLKISSGESGFDRILTRLKLAYTKLLPWILQRRFLVTATSFLLFALSLPLIYFLPKEFMPAQDQGFFTIEVETNPGSHLEYTNQKILEIEKVVSKNSAVDKYITAVGGFTGEGVNRGSIFVTLKPLKKRGPGESQAEVINELRSKISVFNDVKSFFRDPSLAGLGGGIGAPIEFTLRGENSKELEEKAQGFEKKMRDSLALIDVRSDFQETSIELQILPDRKKSAKNRVPVEQVAFTVRALLAGVDIGKIEKNSRSEAIRVQLSSESPSGAFFGATVSSKRTEVSKEEILNFQVRNLRGRLVSLRDLVTIKEDLAPQRIHRVNGQRAITISANINSGHSQEQALGEVEKIKKQVLANSKIEMSLKGAAKTFQKSFQDLGWALIIGLLVAYMVLAAQFNSFFDPLTIYVSLPFSVSGSLLALWLTGGSLNVFSLIGFVLLLGIVKKNSILIVEFVNQVRKRGESVHESLLEACPLRLRPILMTAVSTIVAALPAALLFGPGAESRRPMAVVIIGGMIISTFFTLIVVPCVYSWMAPISKFGATTAPKVKKHGVTS